jgi:hypothetical protein
VGEALGVGGRGARRQGGTGWRRQGRWRERRWEGEVGSLTSGGVARGVAGSGAHQWGRCGAIGRCEVGRVAQGRTGDVGGAGARGGSVGWARGVRMGPGDGSLVHHPR